MSNRIRILVSHPKHGTFINGNALRLVEQEFLAKELRIGSRQKPEDFRAWPRWKRAGWMVKKLGSTWMLKVFREGRRTRSQASLFWNEAGRYGIAMPRRRRHSQVQAADKKWLDNILAQQMEFAREGQPGVIWNVEQQAPRLRVHRVREIA